MLIEDLIRLGRPMLEGGLSPRELLELITDIADPRAKNFYRHVFVVEVPADEGAPARVLERQIFGQNNDDGAFEVNLIRAAAAPVILPSGGNPINPQGYYGVPVYLCYEKHIQHFQESPERVVEFLNGRLERTPGFLLSEAMRNAVAEAIHGYLQPLRFEEKKVLGILVLARCGSEEFYQIQEGLRENRLGLTSDGRSIVPNDGRILEGIWCAKVQEGRQAGERTGRCTFSGFEGEVISTYCKAWPWAFPTWNCPLPNGGDEKYMVEGIAVSESTYRALTLGACIFNKLARPITSIILPELFAPAENRAGKEGRSRTSLTTILGSAYLLPVTDSTFEDAEQRQEFVDGVRGLLYHFTDRVAWADRYITIATGIESVLPPEMDKSDYRLSLVYFSGEYSRGDVHLRALIEDVLPSTIKQLARLARANFSFVTAVFGALLPSLSAQQTAYLEKCYQSVPYLLARAYGGSFLWKQLEGVFHRRSLIVSRVIANSASRMQSLISQWPHSRFTVSDEVGFYLSVLHFLDQYNHQLAGRNSGEDMPMRPWKELIRSFERDPVESLEFQSLSELGFACGLLIRWFSRRYYGVLGSDKDFLKDRVLTFGANVTPKEIHTRGIQGIRDVAAKFRHLQRAVTLGSLGYYPKEERKKHIGDFEKRLGAVLNELDRQSIDYDKGRDLFMTGFWSGYSLQGYDHPRKPNSKTKQPVNVTEE